MLDGKFWLLPSGQVVDVTTSEHAIYARKVMLRLPQDDRSINGPNMCSPLSASEIGEHRRRGVPEDVLNFFTVGSPSADPRIYTINAWGWIRGRFIEKRFPGFWMRRIDDQALQTIRSASDFWSAQKQLTEFDMINVTEHATGDCYEIPVLRLRNPGASAVQLLEKSFKKQNLI